ncbi:hypothetical protein GCM10027073_35510 [Streptomyces chlorus]
MGALFRISYTSGRSCSSRARRSGVRRKAARAAPLDLVPTPGGAEVETRIEVGPVRFQELMDYHLPDDGTRTAVPNKPHMPTLDAT